MDNSMKEVQDVLQELRDNFSLIVKELNGISQTSSNIKIKLLDDKSKAPTRGSEYAAGLDLYANITKQINIPPHITVKVPTGIATEIPDGMAGFVFARSGLATKKGLRPVQGVAVIDSDYRGEWFVPLHNDTNTQQTIDVGERIAQVVFMNYPKITLERVSELTDTVRGDGGFGNSGRF